MKMTRRAALGLIAGLVPAAALRASGPDPKPADLPPGIPPEKGPFLATRASLASYRVPAWFRDAKFGIWAHWGPQSAVEAGDWYARHMYMQGSEQYAYHLKRYGHPSTFGFKDTIPFWKAERFDPAHLVRLYKAAGARYFMSMGCHHDNFDLWDSRHHRWNAARMGPRIDIVGAWRKAAREAGLRFGVSEHLWITYKWFSSAHGADATGPLAGVAYDGAQPGAKDLYVDSAEVWGDDKDFPWTEDQIPDWWRRHWHARITDLIDQHEPDFLYTDGHLPFEELGYSVVSHLYNVSARRAGGATEAVYFSKRDRDSADGLCVLDRERGVLDDIRPHPWQTDTCIGDWHYKRGIRYKTPKTVIDLLVDIVSKNGNLMLNVPLPASGMPDPDELAVIDALTSWMASNAEGIHGTRPWKRFGEGAAVTAAEQASSSFNESHRRELGPGDVRFTTKGEVLYAFAMGRPDGPLRIRSLAPGGEWGVGRITAVGLLGSTAEVRWSQGSDGLSVTLPEGTPPAPALGLRIRGALS